MMREHKSFPSDNEDVSKVLEFYFRICSLEITARQTAVVAATLANGIQLKFSKKYKI